MMTGFIASINDCFKACNDHSNENTVSNPMCTKKSSEKRSFDTINFIAYSNLLAIGSVFFRLVNTSGK